MELKMKKMSLFTAMGLAFAMSASAQTQSNAVDHAEPRPASNVNAQVTTVTETTMIQGDSMAQSVSVSEPVTMTAEMSAESALPEAMKVDDADLEKTMKTMGKNFKAINQSKDILAMSAEVDTLATYASQAEAIGVDPTKASAEAQAEFKRLMQKLRVQLAGLQKAIADKDAEKAKALLEAIQETRKEGHKYFDV